MAAAIVKLDALADAVWSTSENDDAFFFSFGWRLVFGFVRAVVVGRLGLELSGTGIHRFVGRDNAERLPPFANFTIIAIEQCG